MSWWLKGAMDSVSEKYLICTYTVFGTLTLGLSSIGYLFHTLTDQPFGLGVKLACTRNVKSYRSSLYHYIDFVYLINVEGQSCKGYFGGEILNKCVDQFLLFFIISLNYPAEIVSTLIEQI